MSQFDFNKQADLVDALMSRHDNPDRNPHYTIGYLVSMLGRAVRLMPPNSREQFIGDIDEIIDRSRKQAQSEKVAG